MRARGNARGRILLRNRSFFERATGETKKGKIKRKGLYERGRVLVKERDMEKEEGFDSARALSGAKGERNARTVVVAPLLGYADGRKNKSFLFKPLSAES